MAWDEIHLVHTSLAFGAMVLAWTLRRSVDTWQLIAIVGCWMWYTLIAATYQYGVIEAEATFAVGVLVLLVFLPVRGWLGHIGKAGGAFLIAWPVVEIDPYWWKTGRGAAYFVVVEACLWSGCYQALRYWRVQRG